MPLLNLTLPALLNIFFGYIIQIASFDLIPIQSLLLKRLNMIRRDPINANYEALGFLSMYCLINLGTILILMALIPVLVILQLILKAMRCKYPKMANELLKKVLYWNSLITIFRESFVIAIMCALINLKAFTADTNWEIIGSCLTIVILALAILIPIVLLIVVLRNFS